MYNYLILGYSKGLTGHKGLSPSLNLQILLFGVHTFLVVFAENLLLKLEYSCFVINIIILKTFILNIIFLLLGESLAMPFFNQSKYKTKTNYDILAPFYLLLALATSNCSKF